MNETIVRIIRRSRERREWLAKISRGDVIVNAEGEYISTKIGGTA